MWCLLVNIEIMIEVRSERELVGVYCETFVLGFAYYIRRVPLLLRERETPSGISIVITISATPLAEEP